MQDSSIKIFCNYNLISLINKPTCYKNSDKLSILTNFNNFNNFNKLPWAFCVIVTGLSDFHKTITLMKIFYWKIEPEVINYRDYKSFSNEGFRESLYENLKRKLSENSDKNSINVINICNTVLDKQLPQKKSILEVLNRSPFMNKTLSKAVILRTILETNSSKIGLMKTK